MLKGVFMNYKIVSDSSSNLFHWEDVAYASVPMKIIAGEKEYVDDPQLDVAGMVEDLKKHKGKSGSSCPNVQDWLDAFGDADYIFAMTITSELSGSYSSAMNAGSIYEAENPGRKVFVLDSRGTGPEMVLAAQKIKELADMGLGFEEIKEQLIAYHKHLQTLFCLQSLTNLARNGRVNPAVAKISGVLGIQIVGEARYGTITPVHKPRGEKKALQAMMDLMIEKGLFDGAKVRIAHCLALEKANALVELIRSQFPNCSFHVEPCGALCSFYAETGGLIVGMEGTSERIA
jgi:DegV family protein with EDD domain